MRGRRAEPGATMADLPEQQAQVAAYRLRQARLAHGWDQAEHAGKADLTQALLSKAENASPEVTVRALEALAAAVGTGIAALTAECGHCQGQPRPWTACLDCGADGGRPADGERTGER